MIDSTKITKTMFYNMDDNNITNEYGWVIYDLWNYFRPAQIYNFKKNNLASQDLKLKQGQVTTLVCI